MRLKKVYVWKCKEGCIDRNEYIRIIKIYRERVKRDKVPNKLRWKVNNNKRFLFNIM